MTFGGEKRTARVEAVTDAQATERASDEPTAGNVVCWYRDLDRAEGDETGVPTDDVVKYASFGYSVAVSGSVETVVIGAERDAYAGTSAGSAYVFSRANGTWTQRAKLIDDAAAWDSFGQSVTVSGSGDTAVIGADGGAYVFGE